MSTSFSLLFSFFIECILTSQPYGTCDNPFIIFKHTVATTNSKLACANAYSIFPEINDEGADKFIDGKCAHQCKLELPYTCFKLHAPQTQYDEGLLYIDTFEKKISEKWKHLMSEYVHNSLHLEYDAFMDNNIGFWVKSLDQFIDHWENEKYTNANLEINYFGIEWYLYDITINNEEFSKNHKFYSILVHSSSTSIIYEFMSFTKPSDINYNKMRWITDNIPRATFKAMQPWLRSDAASIVPVRIMHATTNVIQLRDFYANVLRADLLYAANSYDQKTKTVFMHLYNTAIEIQFVQRPITQTFGDFRLDEYESLLMETHRSIVSSPFCGQDRWMDTHFAYSTYAIPGLMDQIYANLNYFDLTYKVGKQKYQHSSDHTKGMLELIGYNGEYTNGLWVIEPTGQSIKIGGIISDAKVAYFASIPDTNWCPVECNFGLKPGKVDPSKIFTDDLRFSQHDDEKNQLKRLDVANMNGIERKYTFYGHVALGISLSPLLIYVVMRYCVENGNKFVHEHNEYAPV